MGNISSVYEGCFGEEATKPLIQRATQPNPKSQGHKILDSQTEGHECSTEAASSKKVSNESHHFNKKKVTIKDFNLISVPIHIVKFV